MALASGIMSSSSREPSTSSCGGGIGPGSSPWPQPPTSRSPPVKRRAHGGEATMTTNEDRTLKLGEDRGRVPPVKLAHIVRRTSRFDAMLRWYQTVLGAKVVHSDGMLAFLS